MQNVKNIKNSPTKTSHKVKENALSHHVVAFVLPILINNAGHVLPILPQGYKSLLLLVGGQVDGEHVGAPHRAGEHTTGRIESMTSIESDPVILEDLLPSFVICSISVGIEIYGNVLILKALPA